MPLTISAETRMHGFLAEDPHGKHGRHEHALETFALDAQDLARHFKAYSEHFGVPSEMPVKR